MNRYFALLLFFLFGFCLSAASAYALVPPSTLLINAKTGEVISAEHAHIQRYPASLTKLMTLYLLFEGLKKGTLKPEDKIYFSKNACRAPAFKLYMKPKSYMTVIDAILALVVRSTNDVALAVAEHMAGCESKFARRMNEKAMALGMRRTRFFNASGLPHRQQLSTAYDMARLAKALLDHFPEYKPIFATQSFSFRGKKYINTNTLLGKVPGVEGMKTGYTPAAGWNLVTSYRRGREHLIGIVMGEKSKNKRNIRMQSLLEGRPLSQGEIERITTKTPEHFQATQPFKKWGVQVGVFKSNRQALRHAHTIRRRHLKLLKSYAYRVVKGISRKARQFKTRFNFTSQQQAYAVCESLKKRGVECFVVRET